MFPRRHRAARGECRNASTQVVWKIPTERNPGSKRQGEPGAGSGSKTGAGEGAAAGGRSWQGEHVSKASPSTSQTHRYTEPSCFSRAPGQRLAKLLPSLATFWTGAKTGFVPRKISRRMRVPSPSIVLHPAKLGWNLLPRELPPGICLSNTDGTGVCLQNQNMTLGMLCNGGGCPRTMAGLVEQSSREP